MVIKKGEGYGRERERKIHGAPSTGKRNNLRHSRKLLIYDCKDIFWATTGSSGQKMAVFSKKISTNLSKVSKYESEKETLIIAKEACRIADNLRLSHDL